MRCLSRVEALALRTDFDQTSAHSSIILAELSKILSLGSS
jgi:hypothetical protein